MDLSTRQFECYEYQKENEVLREQLKQANERCVSLKYENEDLADQATGWSNILASFGIAFVVFFIHEGLWGNGVMSILALVVAIVALGLAYRADPFSWHWQEEVGDEGEELDG